MQQRVAIVAVVVVVAATFALIVRPPIKEPSYSHELIAMKREVDSFQSDFFAQGGRVSFGALSEALEEQLRDAAVVDQQNMDRFGVLLDRYGWPTEKQVGREAMHAALTVALRAPDTAFKERVIPLLERLGQDNTPEYARLVDSVRVSKGQPQVYGTVWTCENGRARPSTPVEDPRRAIELRQRVGLDSYERFGMDFCLRESNAGDDYVTVVTPPTFQTGER